VDSTTVQRYPVPESQTSIPINIHADIYSLIANLHQIASPHIEPELLHFDTGGKEIT
jgi:hypothetical protein